MHYNFQHWKNLLSLSRSHWKKRQSLHSLLKDVPVYSNRPRPGREKTYSSRRRRRRVLYHPKAIWERYFKFTSYPSGIFYKEIPRGSYASRQFSRRKEGKDAEDMRLPSSRCESYVSSHRGKNTSQLPQEKSTREEELILHRGVRTRDTLYYDDRAKGGFGIGLWA